MKWRHDMKGLSVKTAVWCSGVLHQLPPGKLSHKYGKSQFLMGKSTINDHFQ